MSGSTKTPVHLLTGFLGAGKTTLLNRLLTDDRLRDSAIIVNEFGEIGLDHHFVEAPGETIVELANGCLCCAVRGQLCDALGAIPSGRFERVLVETSGMADPGPVHAALLASPDLARRFIPGVVVTVVDAGVVACLADEFVECRTQIALADWLLIRGGPARGTADVLRRFNPAAPIVTADGIGALIDILASTEVPALQVRSAGPPASAAHHSARRDIRTLALRAAEPLPAGAIEEFCGDLADRFGPRILRLKGLAMVRGSSHPVVIHGAHGRYREPEPHHQSGELGETGIVIIFRDVDASAIERLFAGHIGMAAPDTPDRKALVDNPLAIAGMKFPG